MLARSVRMAKARSGSCAKVLFNRLKLVIEHHNGCVPFEQGLVGHRSVVIVQLAVFFQDPHDVEVLILQCMSQFVHHDRLLFGCGDPGGDIKGLAVGIIKPGNLLGIQLQDEFPIVNGSGNEAE